MSDALLARVKGLLDDAVGVVLAWVVDAAAHDDTATNGLESGPGRNYKRVSHGGQPFRPRRVPLAHRVSKPRFSHVTRR